MMRLFCCFGKEKPKKKEKISLLSYDELRDQPQDAGPYFNRVPREIMQIILDFCDVESLNKIQRVCRYFYVQASNAITIKLNQFFHNQLSVYKNDFNYFDFKNKKEVFAYLKLMPSQAQKALSASSGEDKQLTILALLLQLADIMVYLTEQKILQFVVYRGSERKAHYPSGFNTTMVTYDRPIVTAMNAEDLKKMKAKKSFADAANIVLEMLTKVVSNKMEIERHNAKWFNLNKVQQELLITIQSIINQLDSEVKKVNTLEPPKP